MIGPSPAGRDFSVPVEVAEEVLEGIVVIAAVGVLTAAVPLIALILLALLLLGCGLVLHGVAPQVMGTVMVSPPR